jgi:hypothetical protein
VTGDFTSVPLRAGDQWTGARLQQGRVLLDGDWNLNLDAAARERRHLAQDTIGPAGVPEGTTGFAISFAGDGSLQIGAGAMWIGGLYAVNPEPLSYAAQEAIPALPTGGNALVYLDAFVQEVQPAEDPDDLLDPALDGVDTTTRTRIAWRVRAVPVDATSCAAAAGSLPADVLSSGRLDVVRTAPATAADPCAPPDDPRGKLPDGLLRIEVLDAGSESTARFAWSYEDGAAAVAATVAGAVVTLAPSPQTTFLPNELVEVSTLRRRADRLDNGSLFTVDHVDAGAGGSVVTLNAPSAVAGAPAGLCLRRWDGQVVGAAGGVAATLAGEDVGVAFTARPGSYLAGDWWGVRVRGSSTNAVLELSDAPPDGTPHYAASLAVVDLDTHTVLSDCRPQFPPLTGIRGGTCTVTAFPGDDLQAAVDQLPAGGGELCLAAGSYVLDTQVLINGKSRVVITGVGPATVLHAIGHEDVLVFRNCVDVTVRDLRAESGLGGNVIGRIGEEHLLGTLTFLGCTDVTVRDCELACPDNIGRTQSAVYAAPSPDRACSRIRVLSNKIEVGDQQLGVLIVSCDESTVLRNEVRLGAAPASPPKLPLPRLADELARFVGSHVAADTGTSGRQIPLPGDATMRVQGAAAVQRLAEQFGKAVNPKALARGTPREQLQRFTRRALLAPQSVELSRTNTRFLAAAATTSRTMAQGIVVAGARADLVRITGNLVAFAIEGIHVGLSGRSGAEIDAGQVIIADNLVAAAVPFFWTRSRHAYYVGSYQRLTMTGNAASLVRLGASRTALAAITATPVEAVRIWGRSGPWLSVRGLELTGPFSTGVAISDLTASDNRPRLHYVSDVLNSSGTGPALSPSTVPHDRCVP